MHAECSIHEEHKVPGAKQGNALVDAQIMLSWGAGHVAPVLDGLSATTMDESLLRREPLLWRYWTAVSWLSYKECRAAVASRKSTLQVTSPSWAEVLLWSMLGDCRMPLHPCPAAESQLLLALTWHVLIAHILMLQQCNSSCLCEKIACDLQVCMGSNLLESGDTFSQLAHDTNSLAAFNTVPGNSYMMVTPLLARVDKAGKTDQGDPLLFTSSYAHADKLSGHAYLLLPVCSQAQLQCCRKIGQKQVKRADHRKFVGTCHIS